MRAGVKAGLCYLRLVNIPAPASTLTTNRIRRHNLSAQTSNRIPTQPPTSSLHDSPILNFQGFVIYLNEICRLLEIPLSKMFHRSTSLKMELPNLSFVACKSCLESTFSVLEAWLLIRVYFSFMYDNILKMRAFSNAN
jgi:hypothetical protein